MQTTFEITVFLNEVSFFPNDKTVIVSVSIYSERDLFSGVLGFVLRRIIKSEWVFNEPPPPFTKEDRGLSRKMWLS